MDVAHAAADVMVFPSRTDTFGLVMLEAMASGTPVAAYNGGPRNVTRLRRVLDRMGVSITALRAAPGKGTQSGAIRNDSVVPCPCVWREGPDGIVPVTIPSYNNENRWYIEKYQSIINLLGERS